MVVNKAATQGGTAPGKNGTGFSAFRYPQLNEALFNKFKDLVYRKTGIFLKPEKKELLNARLGKRLRACGITSFKQYYDYVTQDATGQEIIHLIDCVSTNFTSFFREKAHFDLLTSEVLPAFIHEGRGQKKGMVFWSAACSSGEEPYTLGMVLAEYFAQDPQTRFKIMATDISTKVLSQAERGVYSDERIAKVPTLYLKKYFQKGVGKSAGMVKIKDSVRRLVQFQRFNLMHDFPWQGDIDVIFCRNVMIYFNRETQQRLVDKFYRALAGGGYLFIGHSESISGLEHGFRQVDATAYRKP